MRGLLLAASLVAVAATAPAVLANPKVTDNPWAEAKVPADGPAQAIGGYSAGCVKGAVKLPADGNGYQVMRPSRKRHFGHPLLIDFISDLGKAAKKKKLGVVLIGDLGQPRGGPAPSGHSSHQSGLDADIWFWAPAKAKKHKLTRRDRERVQAKAVVSYPKRAKTRFWSKRVPALLEAAASDERVARIFVNPVIKKQLCDSARKSDASWLHKLRPWWGHDSHFHVRLECPASSPDCEAQDPIPEGDGCGELDWWLDAEKQAERKKGQKKYQDNVRSLPELPDRCSELID